MSSLIINWRFGGWFLQVEPWRHWRSYYGAAKDRRRHISAPVTLRRVPNRPKVGESSVAFYQGRRYAVAIVLLIGALIMWAL